MVARMFVPVPAVPVEPPPLNLVDEANQPADTTNGRWQGGYEYLPESRAKGTSRDVCGFTVTDDPALPAPTGLAATPSATGGTLAAGAKSYQVTAVNGNGETTALTAVSATTTGTTGSVSLTWTAVDDSSTYNVYGRSGTLGKIASGLTGTSFTDTGAASPTGTVPVSNTTGGGGNYTQPSIRQWVPFLVEANDTCSSFGFEEHDYIGRAQRLLKLDAINALENELWTGKLARAFTYPNDYLQNASTVTDVTPTPGTAVSVTRGIQLLEDYNASVGAGGRCMIHLMPQAAPSLLNAQRVGNLLLSELDNIIVPGSGYTGEGPIGDAHEHPATGTTWIYVTDVINVRQGSPQVFPDNFAQAIDFGQGDSPNTIVFRAEQIVSYDWAGLLHAAVLVNLPA